jgi:rubrerythrin
MNIFEAADIFQFAIRIEENGEIFYHRAALIADDKNIADIFNHLADEEIIHKRIFQDLLSKVDVHRQPESYKGEYIAYLRDYIDNKAVFTKEVKDSELSNVHDTLSAINFAMQRELDSVLYYQEIKQFVPEKQHGLIDKIIEEEREHFSKLSTIKKSYTEK